MESGGVVIIGTGMAGYGAAREFRKWDRSTPLTLVTSGDGSAYSKPMLSSALAARKSPAQLVSKDAAGMAAELGAALLTGRTVAGADTPTGTLTLSDGLVLPWSKLVLAMGARPRRPEVGLSGGAAIHSVNGLEEYRAFRESLPEGGRLMILGAGLIGCEFAHDFAAAGYRVTMIANGSSPLAGLLPAALADGLRAALEKLGVRFVFGDPLRTLLGGPHGLSAVLASGAAIETDSALSAIGFDPELGLAREMGLACGKGIQVDDTLRTSRPGIHALGDCAEMSGRWLPFVAPLTHAAKVLGQALAGLPAKLVVPPMPVLIKTPSYPVAVLAPAPGSEGAWEVETDPGGGQGLFRDPQGGLAGFAVTGSRYPARAELLKLVKA